MFERLREFLNFPQKQVLHRLPAKRCKRPRYWSK
jgi:hypothetical protein